MLAAIDPDTKYFNFIWLALVCDCVLSTGGSA